MIICSGVNMPGIETKSYPRSGVVWKYGIGINVCEILEKNFGQLPIIWMTFGHVIYVSNFEMQLHPFFGKIYAAMKEVHDTEACEIADEDQQDHKKHVKV